MPGSFVVGKLYQHDVLIALHTTHLPAASEPHFYRTVTSFNAISQRMGNQWYKLYRKKQAHTIPWHLSLQTYSTDELKIWERRKPNYTEYECFVHATLWHMYQDIKYDYKAQKFVDYTPTLPAWLK